MVKLFRVDDRLIHGQVQTSWIREFMINRIIIIDDNVVNDNLTKQILKIAKPPHVDLVICGTDRAMALLAKDAQQQNARTLVIFKTITTAAEMKKQGLEIKSMVIGPTSNKEGTIQMGKNTYFTEEELAATRYLNDEGVSMAIQLLPSEPRIEIGSILEKM